MGQNDGIADAPMPQSSQSLVRVSGEVTVAESLKRKISTGQTLFIVAKSINSPGAPVAVVRMQTGQWPLKFTLDDSLAMMPERKLSTAGTVMIEVRVSQGGTAASQSGDLKSAPAIVDPHSGKSVHLVIDHVIS
jgi:cytochrome c-type biogenesis protein CcmH